MKCNNDCFNCTRPASKCHGGDTRTANNGERWATKKIKQTSDGVHVVPNNGRKKHDCEVNL